ncbi:barstar family protein [Streptosporangium sp. NPDC050855]|uniref:barstar family protein n=1 Tax=Streptosporangium sp. NPDC050855 TaxID=3366194 RepID=UPI003788D00F
MPRGTFRHGPVSEVSVVFGGAPLDGAAHTVSDGAGRTAPSDGVGGTAPDVTSNGSSGGAQGGTPDTAAETFPSGAAGAAPGTAIGTMEGTLTVHRLDGAKITTSAEAMDAIAEALDLPDHFGHNLDALYDVLTDLSWLPPGEHLLVWTEPSALRAADRPAYEAVRTVLADAVADDAPGESFLSVLILTD